MFPELRRNDDKKAKKTTATEIGKRPKSWIN